METNSVIALIIFGFDIEQILVHMGAGNKLNMTYKIPPHFI